MTSSYVFSTLSNDMAYTHWIPGPDGGSQIEDKSIFIQGGAGVAQKAKAGSDIWTPHGRVTEVSEEDMALLEKNAVFQLHQKNGFIKVQKKSADIEKVAADMNRADKSAPLTEADIARMDVGMVVSTDVPKSTARPGL